MSQQVIARVRLSAGQVGFYDDLTRIYLTIANPEKNVLAGMNTTNIKRGVHSGRLRLISGLLEPEKRVVEKDINVPKEETLVKELPKAKVEAEKPKAAQAIKAPEAKKEEALVVEEPKQETATEDVVVETVVAEEVVVEDTAAETVEAKPVKRAPKKK